MTPTFQFKKNNNWIGKFSPPHPIFCPFRLNNELDYGVFPQWSLDAGEQCTLVYQASISTHYFDLLLIQGLKSPRAEP